MEFKSGKEVQSKLTKGLLDMIILDYVREEGAHGYQIITKIRKDFGVYFGPSTVYPLLGRLEKKGYLKSAWDMTAERPRKIYKLTTQGQELLSFTMNSLKLISKSVLNDNVELQATAGTRIPLLVSY